jgi:hypothetical protein
VAGVTQHASPDPGVLAFFHQLPGPDGLGELTDIADDSVSKARFGHQLAEMRIDDDIEALEGRGPGRGCFEGVLDKGTKLDRADDHDLLDQLLSRLEVVVDGRRLKAGLLGDVDEAGPGITEPAERGRGGRDQPLTGPVGLSGRIMAGRRRDLARWRHPRHPNRST